MGFFISNMVRAFFLGLTQGRLARAPRGALKRYYQQFSRCASIFALVTDVAVLTVGASLKRKEKLSGRLADLLSAVYIGSAAMKFYELESKSEMLPFLQWSCEDLLYRFQSQLHEFLLNMPNRWLSALLRMLVLPLGRRIKPPNDHLGTKVAKLLLYPSQVRARLSQHVYTRNTPHNPIGLIESVLDQVIAIEPLEKKLKDVMREHKIKGKTFEETVHQAKDANFITAKEAERLLKVREARMKIINVDDFSPEELRPQFLSDEE